MHNKIEKPLVSIIVPVYNAEKTISRCVDSLIKQTYSKIEIILVENGSTDRSSEICDRFSDERIKMIHIMGKGVSKARNKGLEVSHGDYITFCDSDDFYSDDHIEKSINAALIHNADVIICGYYVESNNTFYKIQLDGLRALSKHQILNSIVIDNYIMGACWNKLFKKSSIAGLIFPEDMTILEDTYFFLKVIQNAKKIYYINESLYYYCDNSESVVRNIRTLFSNDQLLYIKSYKKILNDFNFTKSEKELIKARIFIFAVWGKNLLIKEKIESPAIVNSLQIEIKKEKKYFLKSTFFSAKYKLKIMVSLYMSWILKIIKILQTRIGDKNE